MNPQQQELLEKIKAANNILVTVSANPSVDQLAACLGMTLLLNKLKKHATAVFSGEVPSTIEFLKPEETLEKNTDSLRDFIISLDKSKADKLRYKVEDQVVRIFITPYRTSITDKDLEFSQGDFNVDVVLCLGVNRQEDLDQAITVHGRILHDATVLSINTVAGGELGSINWTEPTASSLSELVAELGDILGKELIDGQIATSLLTGIVAETDRFSNEKTSPETMRLSAALMAAGANQQLVATELDTKSDLPQADQPVGDSLAEEVDKPEDDSSVGPDGTLEITHSGVPLEDLEMPEPLSETDTSEPETPQEASDEVDIDLLEPPGSPNIDDNQAAPSADIALPEPVNTDSSAADESPNPDGSELPPTSRMMLQPPSMGGTLTANSTPQDQVLQDPLTATPPVNQEPMLDRSLAEGIDTPVMPATPAPLEPLLQADASVAEPPAAASTPDPVIQMPPSLPTTPADNDDNGPPTLVDLEKATNSPHVTASETPAEGEQTPPAEETDLEAARDAVIDAISASPPTGPLPPTRAAGATGYLNVRDLPGVTDDTATTSPAATPDLTDAAAAQPTDSPLPPPPAAADDTSAPASADAGTPPAPPVPPPLPLNELTKFTSPGQ